MAEQADPVNLEIVSKDYSSGYLPTVGSYVEYEVRLTNEGSLALENQSLQVSLVSEGGKTSSSASYTLVSLAPSESMTLHLGPFKLEEDGGHRLLAELDAVVLGFEPDSFTVYRPDAVQALLVAGSLIVAGAGIIGFSRYRKSKTV